MQGSATFHSDPEVLGGTVVFRGTRVPLRNLTDYLEGGYSLGEFLDDFPSVTREQAVAGLEEAREGLRETVLRPSADAAKLGSRIANRFAAVGLDADIQEPRGQSVTPLDLDR